MTVDKKLSEKWQYGIKRATAKISLLSWVKIEKHEYLAGENILSLQQHNINGRSQIHLPLLRKAFKKQTTIEEQGGETGSGPTIFEFKWSANSSISTKYEIGLRNIPGRLAK